MSGEQQGTGGCKKKRLPFGTGGSRGLMRQIRAIMGGTPPLHRSTAPPSHPHSRKGGPHEHRTTALSVFECTRMLGLTSVLFYKVSGPYMILLISPPLGVYQGTRYMSVSIYRSCNLMQALCTEYVLYSTIKTMRHMQSVEDGAQAPGTVP